MRIAFDAKPMPLFETMISGWPLRFTPHGQFASHRTSQARGVGSRGKQDQVIDALTIPKQTAGGRSVTSVVLRRLPFAGANLRRLHFSRALMKNSINFES
jgi:hypothetical protein